MSRSFLFELGTEEMPADMIGPAEDQLRIAVERLLGGNELAWREIENFSTPRRLAIQVVGLPETQPDQHEVITGPPSRVAFDAEGNPLPAATGFARKLGVDLGDLELEAGGKGEYLVLRRTIPGRSVQKILESGLPDIVSSISWPRNMYWTSSRFRFIRPLRWFVALLDDVVVSFEFEGVRADRFTRGHRLLGSSRIEISEPSAYRDLLRDNFVLVDESERRERIELGLKEAQGHLRLKQDLELLETVVQLNEYPSVLKGDFSPQFLEIPEEVLVTVMRFHQKYFSLEDERGSLAPHFLTVVNTDGDPDGRIRRGHEKVLQARLEDAEFFWRTDRQRRLEERVEDLAHILFQESLGTYLDKTNRIRTLCRELDGGEDLDLAARLAKADLTTEMVREFSELQGIMGGLYAREEGLPEMVWRAIYDQYRPVAVDDQLPGTRTGILLSAADRIDTIVGCFGAGIVPTGSSDPFALRRQAQGLIRLLLKERLQIRLRDLVSLAQSNFIPSEPVEEVRSRVLEFLEQRIQFVLQREGLPADVLRAVLRAGLTTVADLEDRCRALVEIRRDPDFEALAVAFKRSKNILSKAEGDLSRVDPGLLTEESERELFEAWRSILETVRSAVADGEYLTALRAVATIRKPVDRFFDEVLVMAENPDVRRNRMALLSGISEMFMSIADFSEIEQQGGNGNAK